MTTRNILILLVLPLLLLSCGGGAQDAPEGIPVLDATGIEVGILPYTESIFMDPALSGAPISLSSVTNPRALLDQGSLIVTVNIDGTDYFLYGNPAGVVMKEISVSDSPSAKKPTAWILLLLLAVGGFATFFGLWRFANRVTDTRTGGWEIKKFSIPVSTKDSSKVVILSISGPITWGPVVNDADAFGQLLKTGFSKAAKEAGDLFEAWLLTLILDPAHGVYLVNLEESIVGFLKDLKAAGWDNNAIKTHQGLQILYAGFKTVELSPEAIGVRAAEARGAALGIEYRRFIGANDSNNTDGLSGPIAFLAAHLGRSNASTSNIAEPNEKEEDQ